MLLADTENIADYLEFEAGPGFDPAKWNPAWNPNELDTPRSIAFTAHIPVASADPAVIEAAADLLWPLVEIISYGWTAMDGNVPQIPLNQINDFLAATHLKKYGTDPDSVRVPYLNRLSRARLADSIAGRSSAVHLRSGWEGRRLLFRIDIDAHNGETDAPACAEWVNAVYFAGALYRCPSEQGESLYGFIAIPYYTDKDGSEKPCFSKVVANEIVADIHRAIAPLVKANGFQCGAEAKGSFLIRHQPCDEHGVPNDVPVVRTLDSTMAKRPTFRTLADVEKLRAAVIHFDPRASYGNHAGLTALLAEGLPLAAKLAEEKTARKERFQISRLGDDRIAAALGDEEYDPDNAEQRRRIINWRATPAAGDKRHRKVVSRNIDDSGDKLRNTLDCFARSAQLLGARTTADRQDRIAEITELAHELYIENGLGDDHRDRKREQRFNSTGKWFIATTDDSMAGHGDDPNFFTPDQLKSLATKYASIYSAAEFEAMGITPMMAAVSAATMAKNVCTVITNGFTGQKGRLGDCPHRAVKKMFAHPRFGLPHSDAQVTAAMQAVLRSGAIVCVDRRTRHGQCRRYALGKPEWFAFLSADAVAAARAELEPLAKAATGETRAGAEVGVVNALLVAVAAMRVPLVAGPEVFLPSQYGLTTSSPPSIDEPTHEPQLLDSADQHPAIAGFHRFLGT